MKKLLIVFLVAVALLLGWHKLVPAGKSPFAALSGLFDGFGPAVESDKTTTPASGEGPSAANRYRAPDLEYRLFKIAEITLEDGQKAELVKTLTSLASQTTTPPLLKSKALAIALRLDPANAEASSANSLLERGLVPDPGKTGGKVDSKKLSDELWRLARILRDSPKGGDTNRKLAAHVIDLALAIEPDNVDLAYELKMLETSGSKVDWQPVIGEPSDGMTAATGATADADGEEKPIGPEGSQTLLPRMQALVKGLLVRELDGSQYAGHASQMNATAVRVEKVREMKVEFNQSVGPDMSSALAEVIKFHRIRHGQLPASYQVEIAFEEQYVPKDGPSAAVACALLLESLLVDIEFDPQFAVTGDLNADGSVQPVGGITGKMRGAQHRDCNVFGLPEANSRVLGDLLIMDGPKALAEIQAFSLTTFDEALALAKVHDQRDEDLRRSIDLFSEVTEVLTGARGMAMLKNSHVQERLRECVRLTPNHLSARYLFLAATGQTESQLSLQGSLEYIDRSAAPMLRVLRQGDFEERTAFSGDEFADATSALRRIRPTLDPRTRDICDAIVDYAKEMRTFVNHRPTSYNGLRTLVGRINATGQSVGSAYDKLESSVDYQEEVMK